MPRKVEVEIVGDSRQLEKAFARSSRSAKEFNRDVSRLGRGAVAGSGIFKSLGRNVAYASGAFLGGAGLVAVMQTSVEAASNLNEQMSKTNATFGDSAKTVTSWAKDSVDALGLAEDQALETASSFGALLRPLGLTGSVAAKQSEQLTQLGADLASFYNTSVQDALDAIRSGLVGEAEPLRQYGILLSETRVQQEAMRETGKKMASQLTNQDKVMARITLMFKDAKIAVGDWGRTSGGTAGQIKKFEANIRNLQIALGQQLLPGLTKAVTKMNEWMQKPENQAELTRDFADAVSVLGAAAQVAAGAFKLMNDALQRYHGLTKALEKHGFGFMNRGLVPDLNALQKKLGLPAGGLLGMLGVGGGGGGGGRFTKAAGAGPRRGMGFASGERPAPARTATLARVVRAGLAGPAPGFEEQLSRRLDRLQDLSLKKQLAQLKQLAEIVKKRMEDARTIKGRLALQDKLVDILRQEKDVQDQITEANKKTAEAAAKRRENRQFRALGFGPGGEDLVPGVKALQRQLAKARDAVAGSFLDTAKTRGILARISKVLSGTYGKLGKDVRAKIKEMLDGITEDLKSHSGELTKWAHVSSTKIMRELGIGGTAAGMVIAQIGRGMTAPPKRSRAFAGAGAQAGITFNGPVTFNGVQDVKQMENQLTKRAGARGHNRRGAR